MKILTTSDEVAAVGSAGKTNFLLAEHSVGEQHEDSEFEKPWVDDRS
jgi:hypothetical protein